MSWSQDRLEPRPAAAKKRFSRMWAGELILRFGFWKANDALAVFELAALAKEFHAFKTFQDTATGGDAALAFQTWMLAHKLKMVC